MKKKIILLGVSFVIFISNGFAQVFPCVRDISTNPNNPHNTEWISMFGPNEGGSFGPSFVNSWFNWYPSVFTLQIPISNQNWERPISFTGTNLNMRWPFEELNDDYIGSNAYLYQNINVEEDRDFHWEDGWELLWLNTGYLPNGARVDAKPQNSWYMAPEDPQPKNMPFFVLYNRYRGTLRIFANLWKAHGAYNHVNVELQFHRSTQNGNFSGIFRHAGGLDLPLDKKSEITSIKAPRRLVNIDESQWYVVDMQLGYDACQCKIPTSIGIKIEGVTVLDVDLESRNVSIEKEITKLDQFQKNWLQFQQTDPKNENINEPGNVIYKSIGGLLIDYKKALDKYNNDLKDYNSLENNLKKELVTLTGSLASGVLTSPISNALKDYLKKNQIGIDSTKKPGSTPMEDEAKKAINSMKKVIASEFDFLNVQLGVIKDKPIRPQVPVATFSEGRIKGKIRGDEVYYAGPLFAPGTRPTSNNNSTGGIRAISFPAYNNVVGLFALLKTPSIKLYNCPYLNEPFYYVINERPTKTKQVALKLTNGLDYTLNPALDWDLNKTKILFAFQLEFEETDFNDEFWKYVTTQLSTTGGNFELSHRITKTNDTIAIILTSQYYNTLDAKNVGFALTMSHLLEMNPYTTINGSYSPSMVNGFFNNCSPDISRIKLKIVGDFWFNQLGYDGEQINTFQVFTYDLFNSKKDKSLATAITEAGGSIATNNNWMNYTPGTINLNGIIAPGDPRITEQVGNTIYIRAENINVIGQVGYQSFSNSNGPLYLKLEAFNSVNLLPGSSLLRNASASIKKDMYGEGKNPQASASFITNFCSNGDYKANQASDRAVARIAAEQKIEEERKAKEKMSIAVYPNPASSYLIIEVKKQPQETQNVQFVMLDITGRPVLQRQEKSNSSGQYNLNLPTLSQGIYMLQITVGQETLVEKIVIK